MYRYFASRRLAALVPALAAAALVIAAFSAPVRAAPIAYQIDLTVTANTGGAFGIAGTGGTYIATVDLDPTLVFAQPGNATNFYLDLNGTVFQTNPTTPVGANLAAHGANAAATSAPAPFSPSDPNGFVDYLLRLNMISPTGSPQNAALDGISISGSSSNDITWGAYDASMGESLTGTFTIAVFEDSVAVPAPGAAALLALGLVGIRVAGLRRTRRRNRA